MRDACVSPNEHCTERQARVFSVLITTTAFLREDIGFVGEQAIAGVIQVKTTLDYPRRHGWSVSDVTSHSTFWCQTNFSKATNLLSRRAPSVRPTTKCPLISQFALSRLENAFNTRLVQHAPFEAHPPQKHTVGSRLLFTWDKSDFMDRLCTGVLLATSSLQTHAGRSGECGYEFSLPLHFRGR